MRLYNLGLRFFELRHSTFFVPLKLEKFNCQTRLKRVLALASGRAESDLETKLSHQSASSCIFTSFLNSLFFLVLPLFYGHSALILQNPSFVTTFFRNFAAELCKKMR